jgi:hypothetical protein
MTSTVYQKFEAMKEAWDKGEPFLTGWTPDEEIRRHTVYVTHDSEGNQYRMSFNRNVSHKMSGRLRVPSGTRRDITVNVTIYPPNAGLWADYSGTLKEVAALGESSKATERADKAQEQISDKAQAVFGLKPVWNY